MGTINKLTFNQSIGEANITAASVEGEFEVCELEDVLRALKLCKDPCDEPCDDDVCEEDDDCSEEKSEKDAYGFFNPAAVELDAARGAVRILADGLGIGSSEQSNVAKLAKQVHSEIQKRDAQYWGMTKEVRNLDAAMRRSGFLPPELDRSMELSKQCQVIAHHLDETARGMNSGEPLPDLSTRQGKMGGLAMVQKQAHRMMVDLATIDGLVTTDMSGSEATEATMAWAVKQDEKRKQDEKQIEAAKALLEGRASGVE